MSDVQLSLTGSEIDDALVKANAPLQFLTVGSPPTGGDTEKLVTGEAIYNLATNITTSNFTNGTIVTSTETISANKNDTTIPTTLAVHNHIRGFVSSDQTIPSAAGDSVTVAHGLSETPLYITGFFKCTGGTTFPVGAMYEMRNYDQITADATNIYYTRFQVSGYNFIVPGDSSKTAVNLSDFTLVLKASL